jgi:NTP pyrophosphatase (non-canonical NTP hydrolase)
MATSTTGEQRTENHEVCERLIQRDALSLADFELTQARENWPPFNSAHEGYAVLAEELDELWQHIKTNQQRRDLRAMRKEAIQVAAMALRFAIEVCNDERGRK